MRRRPRCSAAAAAVCAPRRAHAHTRGASSFSSSRLTTGAASASIAAGRARARDGVRRGAAPAARRCAAARQRGAAAARAARDRAAGPPLRTENDDHGLDAAHGDLLRLRAHGARGAGAGGRRGGRARRGGARAEGRSGVAGHAGRWRPGASAAGRVGAMGSLASHCAAGGARGGPWNLKCPGPPGFLRALSPPAPGPPPIAGPADHPSPITRLWEAPPALARPTLLANPHRGPPRVRSSPIQAPARLSIGVHGTCNAGAPQRARDWTPRCPLPPRPPAR
jgi:hypothetical protein